MYHKPFNSVHSILVQPKEPTPKDSKCGVIYKIVCSGCDLSDVGENGDLIVIHFRKTTTSPGRLLRQ